MPLIDMPLGELKKYKGINPKPKDFDEYWERALREMRETDPEVEMVPAKFHAPFVECFDLYFTGVRKARIHAKYLRPKSVKRPHPAVLFFHGYTDYSGEWWSKLPYTAMGMAVAALDCRGQAGTSEDTGGVKGMTWKGQLVRGLDDCPDNMLMRHIILDTAQLAAIVMGFPEIDAKRVGATGGSQGGGLTLWCAALEPRLKRIVPVYPWLSDYKRAWEMDTMNGGNAEVQEFLRTFDPRHEREDEIWTRLGYLDVQHMAHRIKAEVLMGVGLMDQSCLPSMQFAAYNKITSKKRLALYPDFGHEYLPGLGDILFEFLAGL